MCKFKLLETEFRYEEFDTQSWTNQSFSLITQYWSSTKKIYFIFFFGNFVSCDVPHSH